MAPRGLVWFRVYCLAMALGFAMIMVFIAIPLWGLLSGKMTSSGPPEVFYINALVFGCGGSFGLLLYLIAPWVLPQRPLGWIAGMVLIAGGLMWGPCCWPVLVPMVWLWCEADNRVYFGLQP